MWCALLGLSLAGADIRLQSAQVPWLLPAPLALAALALAAALQGLPAMGALIPHPGWQAASDLLGEPLSPLATATADPPWRALGPALLASLAFTRAFLIGADVEGSLRLLRWLAWSGAAYAVYAIAAFVIAPDMLLWRQKESYLTVLTGTFVNRNTAATFFGSHAILWLVLLLRAVRRDVRGELTVRETLAEWFSRGLPRPVLLGLAGFAACLTATAMTGSRAGFSLTLAGLLLAGVLWSARGSRRAASLGGLAVAGILLAVAVQIAGGLVFARIDVRGFGDAGRFDTYVAVIGLIRAHPWLGIGLGQFEAAFPAYRDGSAVVPGVWDKAHSVPLELAAEVGLPAAGAVLAAWVAVAFALVRGFRGRRHAIHGPVAAIAVGALGGLHALVDFSLQIPGYAVLFAAVVGAGLAQATAAPPRPRTHREPQARHGDHLPSLSRDDGERRPARGQA